MTNLNVELYGEEVGQLIPRTTREFEFNANPQIFQRFNLGSSVMSESVPLLEIQVQHGRARRENFFAELLPEGDNLELLANLIGANKDDVITILSHYGRDVAGALQIYDPNSVDEPRVPMVEKINGSEIARLLREKITSPLGNKPRFGKSSLAGVQDKIVLSRLNGEWHQALNGYPSTHILKPESTVNPTTIFDEEYGSRINRVLGLAAYETSLEEFDGFTALVIERYDRNNDYPQGRIHQEDMNQVLGARKDQKYQKFGGKVSLARIAHVINRIEGKDGLAKLAKLNTMSVAIGNLDMHAKNISILHLPNEDTLLAPAYDSVPQAHRRNLDGELALAVNRKYLHSVITAEDLVVEAESWGMNGAKKVVDETLQVIKDFVGNENPDPRAHPGLSQEIGMYCQNLLDGKSTTSRS